jgi:hypothetical protein
MSRRILPIDGQWDGYREFVRDNLSVDPSVSRGVLWNDLRQWDAYDLYLQGHSVRANCFVIGPTVTSKRVSLSKTCISSFNHIGREERTE